MISIEHTRAAFSVKQSLISIEYQNQILRTFATEMMRLYCNYGIPRMVLTSMPERLEFLR